MNRGQLNHIGSPPVSQTVSAAIIIGLLKAVDTIGIVLGDTLSRLQLADNVLTVPTSRVAYPTLISLLDTISDLSGGRRDIAIELGRHLLPGSFSALGYAAVSCNTLGEAIRLIPAYEKVALTPGITELKLTAGKAQLCWTATSKPYSYLLEEVILSAWIQQAKTITNNPSLPLEVAFTGPQPSCFDPFYELFGEHLHFEQSSARVVFDEQLMNIPILQSDPFINNLMKEQVAQLFHSLDTDVSLARKVAQSIRVGMANGDIDQEYIAYQHCLGVRTLRRKLKEEGTSYQDILDQVRREKAREYLADKRRSIYEIAMLLGYSEHSAFSAAFKRWYGLSPNAYREGLK